VAAGAVHEGDARAWNWKYAGPRRRSPHRTGSPFTAAKIMSAAQSGGGLGEGLTCEKTKMHGGYTQISNSNEWVWTYGEPLKKLMDPKMQFQS
jgi:hypothetical protein